MSPGLAAEKETKKATKLATTKTKARMRVKIKATKDSFG